MALDLKISPKGIAKYPSLTRPDTKYNKDGTYKTTLVIEPTAEGYDDFVALFAEAIEDAKVFGKVKKAKNIKEVLPYKINEDGNLEITFAMNAKVAPKGKEPFEQKPQIRDAKGKLLSDAQTKNMKIGSGTVMRAAFTFEPYFNEDKNEARVQTRLRQVKIIDLVEYSGSGSNPFEEEEGFAADEIESDTNESTSNESEGEENDDF